MLQRVDDAILGVFTGFSHGFQRLTGRTNFFLAKVAVAFISLHPFLHLVHYWTPIFPHPPNIILVVAFPFVSLILIRYTSACDQAEEGIQNGKRTLPAFVLILRNSQGIRILFSLLSLSDIVSFIYDLQVMKASLLILAIDDLMTLGLTIFLYLILVDPMPPGTSKVREWLDRLLTPLRKTIPASASS